MMKAKERFHNFVGEPANHPKVLEKSTHASSSILS